MTRCEQKGRSAGLLTVERALRTSVNGLGLRGQAFRLRLPFLRTSGGAVRTQDRA